jgi:glucose/arabinose dehydrogenase
MKANMKISLKLLALAAAALLLAACNDSAQLSEDKTVGSNPTLPEPHNSLIPTVNVAPAKGWSEGAKPKVADGLAVTAFATGLDHPRALYALPNGDVLVAETNAPKPHDEGTGLIGVVMGIEQSRAGAATPTANRITLLRDADGDGIAQTKTEFISGLNSPFGIALVGNDLYVANTDSVMRFPYTEAATKIDGPGQKVADLPAGPLNHHWTKGLVASPDGTRLYASIGSNSNAGENGLDKEGDRAQILEIDRASGKTRVFATGLRNPVWMAFQPQSNTLWVVVNERDMLGSDLVPDYLTSVKEGAFYGWPFSYWGQHVDDRVKPQNPDMVAKAIAPDYALGNHVAPLGLAFAQGTLLPENLRNGAFVGEHGSWNREPFAGYKVVFIPFDNGKPSGPPREVLTGFISSEGNAYGRPVGVAIDRAGGLLVADDVGNTVWRVAPATGPAAQQLGPGAETTGNSP